MQRRFGRCSFSVATCWTRLYLSRSLTLFLKSEKSQNNKIRAYAFIFLVFSFFARTKIITIVNLFRRFLFSCLSRSIKTMLHTQPNRFVISALYYTSLNWYSIYKKTHSNIYKQHRHTNNNIEINHALQQPGLSHMGLIHFYCWQFTLFVNMTKKTVYVQRTRTTQRDEQKINTKNTEK